MYVGSVWCLKLRFVKALCRLCEGIRVYLELCHSEVEELGSLGFKICGFVGCSSGLLGPP